MNSRSRSNNDDLDGLGNGEERNTAASIDLITVAQTNTYIHNIATGYLRNVNFTLNFSVGTDR
ncbi:MAG: hypothetical protein OXQ29_23245 [Rhodospirillaceae bacterium]|nr:hypothetical protein [Rhodospirillaceae bacterium]